MIIPEGIYVIDDFLESQDQKGVFAYCKIACYEVDMKDDPTSPTPTGVIHNIPEHENIVKFFTNKIQSSVSGFEQSILQRRHINYFHPRETPFFHRDYESDNYYTFIYYPQMETHDVNEGGETQFHIDDLIYGIPPKSNRLLYFKSNIWHRATTFRNHGRFTLALIYNK